MTKKELIDAVKKNTYGLTKAQVEQVIGALAAAVHEELKCGGSVELPEVGRFKVKERAARTSRNPITGEAIQVPAKKVAAFSPAKSLRDAVAQP